MRTYAFIDATNLFYSGEKNLDEEQIALIGNDIKKERTCEISSPRLVK